MLPKPAFNIRTNENSRLCHGQRDVKAYLFTVEGKPKNLDGTMAGLAKKSVLRAFRPFVGFAIPDTGLTGILR